MSSQNQQNTIETVLHRLNMAETIPKFKEMNINRIVSLRKMTDEQLRMVVPDDEMRQKLLEAISSRGNVQARRAAASDQAYPPRMTELHPIGGANNSNDYRGTMVRGRGRGGGGRGRGSGSGSGGGNGNGGMHGDESTRPCRHYFSLEGCRYADTCRYSHDESLRQQAEESNVDQGHADTNRQSYEFSKEVVLPTGNLKYLVGVNGAKLKAINDKYGTYNERFMMVSDSKEIFTLKIFSNSKDSLERAAEAMLNAVGVKSKEERKVRSDYVLNELEINTHAAKLLAVCNIMNEGTPRYLSDKIMRNVVSAIRFVRPQRLRHFCINCNNTDKEKLDVVSKIISQVSGVQAIVFCEQRRVESFATEGGIQRLTKHFNSVRPKFLYRKMSKEERMKNLEEFKEGIPNESGVKQRLLITNEDYAKLARKTVIPFVNLVINLNVPRDEFYVIQSLVAGRQGTVGISFQFVSQQDSSKFQDLKKIVDFEEFTNEAELREAMLQLSYDTVDNPLTPPNAEPPADWRDHLDDPKPTRQHLRR